LLKKNALLVPQSGTESQEEWEMEKARKDLLSICESKHISSDDVGFFKEYLSKPHHIRKDLLSVSKSINQKLNQAKMQLYMREFLKDVQDAQKSGLTKQLQADVKVKTWLNLGKSVLESKSSLP
jgi:hypothetical protein